VRKFIFVTFWVYCTTKSSVPKSLKVLALPHTRQSHCWYSYLIRLGSPYAVSFFVPLSRVSGPPAGGYCN